jgi:hypothetical protein
VTVTGEGMPKAVIPRESGLCSRGAGAAFGLPAWCLQLVAQVEAQLDAPRLPRFPFGHRRWVAGGDDRLISFSISSLPIQRDDPWRRSVVTPILCAKCKITTVSTMTAYTEMMR